MLDCADETALSETYRRVVRPVEPVWRIRHPERPYYVAFLVVSGHCPATPAHLGLVHREGGPPADAMQFGRKRDAEQFAQAFLATDIAWAFEGPATPPAWSEAQP